MDVFSTITSPLFSEVVIVLENRDISGLPMQVTLFETLRAMTRIRSFDLVFLLGVSDFLQEEAGRKLTGALNFVIGKGLLDFLGSAPTIRVKERHHRAFYSN